MTLGEVLSQQFDLPSIPRVVALLLNEFEHAEIDLRRVSQLISTDPALTTRLLRLANSEYLHMSGRISSVSEALALLDMAHVKTIAVAAASISSPKAVPGIQLQRFWDYSLNVAKISRSLAGLTRQNQQAAYTCGMIHAIGELAMHLAMPKEMAQLNETLAPLDMQRAKMERKKLGYCYASVGAGFAQQWHFPAAMVDALQNQYAPFDNNVYEPLAGIIHLAAWRARAKDARMDDRAMAVTFPDAVGVALDLDIDTVLQQDPFDWAAHT